MAVNLINRHVLEAGRTEAKQLFRSLEDRRAVALTNLRAEGGAMVRVDLRLDPREFDGALNFSAFRDGVLALLSQLSNVIQSEAGLTTFRPIMKEGEVRDADTPERLFAVGGFTVHEQRTNVLMLGVTPSSDSPVLCLQLVYVDPEQFQTAAESTS